MTTPTAPAAAVSASLSHTSFAALAEVAGEATGPVSPLARAASPAGIDAGHADLAESGVLDASGAIVDGWREPLAVLAGASALSHLAIVPVIAPPIEIAVYAAPAVQRDATVTLAQDAEGVSIASPTDVEATMEMLCDALGSSRIRASLFEGSFSVPEALALAVVVDAERARTMRALAGDDPGPAACLDAAGVVSAVERSMDGPPGITPFIVDACATGAELEDENAEAALEGLTGRGLLHSTEDGYRADVPLIDLAARLVRLDQVVIARAVSATGGGGLARAGFWCLQCGVRDLLYIEPSGDGMTIETASAARVLAYLRMLLERPGLPEAHEVPDAAPQPTNPMEPPA